MWDSIMEDFLSLCSDADIESEKTLAQIKRNGTRYSINTKPPKTTTTKLEGTVKLLSFLMTSTNSCQGPTRSTLNSSRK